MKRFRGLLRDTWWLWLVFVGAGILLTSLVNSLFFVTLPVTLFAFVYYGLVRYDEDGQPVEGEEDS